MVFGIEGIAFPFLYHHPFVAEKGGYLDRLVMTEFHILQSIALFQAFQIFIVTTDVSIRKSGNLGCTMYTLRNLLVRIERFFDWSPDLLLFGQI